MESLRNNQMIRNTLFFLLLAMCSVSSFKSHKLKRNHSETKDNLPLGSNVFEKVLDKLTNELIQDEILSTNIRKKKNLFKVKQLYMNGILDLGKKFCLAFLLEIKG